MQSGNSNSNQVLTFVIDFKLDNLEVIGDVHFIKMGKNTNQRQYQTMVSFMERNPNIAKGLLATKDGKATAAGLWNSLKDDLNSQGPPIHSVDEWKKIWADFKYGIKKKLARNKLQIRGTGGGPYKAVSLSVLEEKVAEIISINMAVEGVKGSAFGGNITERIEAEEFSHPSPEGQNNQTARVDDEASLHVREQSDLIQGTSGDVIQETPSDSIQGRHQPKKTQKKRKQTNPEEKSIRDKLLEQQTNIQESLYNVITKTLKSIDETNKENLRINKKTYRLKEKSYDLKKQKLEILKRKQVEKMRMHVDNMNLKKIKIENDLESLQLKRQKQAKD